MSIKIPLGNTKSHLSIQLSHLTAKVFSDKMDIVETDKIEQLTQPNNLGKQYAYSKMFSFNGLDSQIFRVGVFVFLKKTPLVSVRRTHQRLTNKGKDLPMLADTILAQPRSTNNTQTNQPKFTEAEEAEYLKNTLIPFLQKQVQLYQLHLSQLTKEKDL